VPTILAVGPRFGDDRPAMLTACVEPRAKETSIEKAKRHEAG
jgi:hypothetical protein